MPDPIVVVDGVEKQFANGTRALARTDFAVHAGEFLTLLGPSGCGKSTLLRIIAGLAPPTAGQVRRSGLDGRTDIAFVFQDPTLMPWATMASNVALPLTLAHYAPEQIEARTREAIMRVGLGGFERAHPRELSGGMRMRASIARALVAQPKLLLMDEPFAALDEITRFKLNEDLLALWQDQGLTVVFVTHSVFEAAFLSSRIAVMSARPGRIVADMKAPYGYPRGSALRLSTEYAAFARQLSEALIGAMAA
jgi:NitT/TauT family transport system ATP-binding protein